MDIQTVKNNWVKEAEDALQVMHHLHEKGDYSYALFFGHLAVVKILKAVSVTRKSEHVPFTLNLETLAVALNIQFKEE